MRFDESEHAGLGLRPGELACGSGKRPSAREVERGWRAVSFLRRNALCILPSSSCVCS